MQMTDTNPKTGSGNTSLASGFGPIPARIGNRPPLVVTNEANNASVRHQVIEALHEFGAKIAVAHRSAAEAFLAQDLYQDAVPHLEAAVRFAPDEVEHLNQLGYVRYLGGDDHGAINAFNAVLEKLPRNADALFNLGMVLFGLGDLVRSEDCFRRSLESRPDDSEAWNNRGVCIHRLGRLQEAAACFKRALELDPTDADARVNLSAIGG